MEKNIMIRHVLKAWFLLLYLDYLMRFRGFQRVHTVVRKQRVHAVDRPPANELELSGAMDLACVFYFKRVLCLQRSAALVLLLRLQGRAAELIIGAQLCPFLSHAWVEIDRRVINDKPYVQEIFQVLQRC
jgi:hypothetical protein